MDWRSWGLAREELSDKKYWVPKLDKITSILISIGDAVFPIPEKVELAEHPKPHVGQRFKVISGKYRGQTGAWLCKYRGSPNFVGRLDCDGVEHFIRTDDVEFLPPAVAKASKASAKPYPADRFKVVGGLHKGQTGVRMDRGWCDWPYFVGLLDCDKSEHGFHVDHVEFLPDEPEPKSEFTVGEYAECVDADGQSDLTEGKRYKVADVDAENIRPEGSIRWFRAWRFCPVRYPFGVGWCLRHGNVRTGARPFLLTVTGMDEMPTRFNGTYANSASMTWYWLDHEDDYDIVARPEGDAK